MIKINATGIFIFFAWITIFGQIPANQGQQAAVKQKKASFYYNVSMLPNKILPSYVRNSRPKNHFLGNIYKHIRPLCTIRNLVIVFLASLFRSVLIRCLTVSARSCLRIVHSVRAFTQSTIHSANERLNAAVYNRYLLPLRQETERKKIELMNAFENVDYTHIGKYNQLVRVDKIFPSVTKFWFPSFLKQTIKLREATFSTLRGTVDTLISNESTCAICYEDITEIVVKNNVTLHGFNENKHGDGIFICSACFDQGAAYNKPCPYCCKPMVLDQWHGTINCDVQ